MAWRHLVTLRDVNGLFSQAFKITGIDGKPDERVAAQIPDGEAFFLERMKVSDIGYWFLRLDAAPSNVEDDPDVFLDLLELLHAECVSLPKSRTRMKFGSDYRFNAPFSKAEGQRVFREKINPVLAMAQPPYELEASGTIRQLPPEDLSGLVDEPLPEDEEAAVVDPVRAAIEQFFRRGAAVHDRLAAVKMLADSLERLRPEVKAELLSKDEAALFNVANNFGIRHNNREQRLDYNRELWLEWMFYVYLATIRAMLRLRDEQRQD